MAIVTAAALEPVLEGGAAHLQRYLRRVGPFSAISVGLLLVLYALVGLPIVLLLAGMVALNGGMQWIAYRRILADRVESAVLWQSCGLWSIVFVLGLTGQLLFSLTALLALLPVAIAVPCVSPRLLLRLSLAGAGFVAVAGIFVVAGGPLSLEGVPVAAIRIARALGMVASTFACMVSVWHARYTLNLASEGLQEANASLRASEARLEQRVRERTAELKASQRELTLARDEAEAANRHKSAFLANMSHELRTPLNAIIGFSEVLGEKIFGELSEKQAEYTSDVHQSGHHLLSLINDILDLSKIEAGRLELQLGTFPLADAIDNALVFMKERAARAGVELVREVEPGVGELLADERKLKQVLINLLSNAVKFTDEGGSVTLRARIAGERVEVEVEDTGIGIAAADQSVIFEEFRQAQAEHASKREGTGLGLALSKRLVELHGGQIGVRSEPGRGSVFFFNLPTTPPGERSD